MDPATFALVNAIILLGLLVWVLGIGLELPGFALQRSESDGNGTAITFSQQCCVAAAMLHT